MEKRKVYGTILALTIFVIMMLGLSYAYFYWSSGTNKTNVNLTVSRGGLETYINYKQGTSVLGTDNYSLQESTSYTGGISATIEFWKNPAYAAPIYGQISLKMLKMLSVFGTTDTNVGKTNTIKWAVTTYTAANSTETLLNEGSFNGRTQGDKFPVIENFELSGVKTYYKIYIWFDSSAIDPNNPVSGEILSAEISASASDVMSYYGTDSLVVLRDLGLDGYVKENEADFTKISPLITRYKQSVANNQTYTTTMNSTITGNKTIGTGYSYNATTGVYTLTGTSTYQPYNSNSIGKYTCNTTSTTCTTMYKIKAVNASSETTNYSEAAWTNYTASMTSSSNKTVATSYTFDGTYYQLSGTITKNTSYSSSHVNRYTCNNNTGTNCSALYKIQTVSGTSVTSAQRKSRTPNYHYLTKADVYTSVADAYNQNDVGIFATEDDLGTSYFFRGNIDYNYVQFGKDTYGNDMYWRIIRINGDGTIRMIYDGTQAYDNGTSSIDRQVGTGAFSANDNDDNTYLGYMYGDAGQSTYELTHSNKYNSTIKTYLEGTSANNYTDGWYYKNILATGYHSYVADAIYCNDRSLASGTGIGAADTSYGAYGRLYTNKTPTLKCDLDNNTTKRDSFTVNTNLGNGLLNYPVGLITADEVSYAGGTYGSSYTNKSYYLYTGQNYWTMSPFYINAGYPFGFIVDFDGYMNGYDIDGVDDTNVAFRPVISIRPDAIKSGSGTADDPFYVPQKPTAHTTLAALNLTPSSGTPDFSKTSCSSGCDEATVGIYAAEDDLGTSFYFRGDVTNNYVKFGGTSSGPEVCTYNGEMLYYYGWLDDENESEIVSGCNGQLCPHSVVPDQSCSTEVFVELEGGMYVDVPMCYVNGVGPILPSSSALGRGEIYYEAGEWPEWEMYCSNNGGTLIENATVSMGSVGSDMYWRIIRINGDGTVRMIYDGTTIGEKIDSIGDSVYFSGYYLDYDNNTYVGYMHATGVNNVNYTPNTYVETHTNVEPSSIKIKFEGSEANNYKDGWYYQNIVATGYHDYVADAIYCNDRSLAKGSSGIWYNESSYGATERLLNNTPTLKCDLAEYTNDSFTVNKNLGNGLLIYPIGLITVDEIIMAGGGSSESNQYYYLNSNSNYWTMTPKSNGSVYAIGDYDVIEAGSFFDERAYEEGNIYESLLKYGVIPVISLKADAIIGGTGTKTDPFRVE